ncbi:hypothetical protein GMSM_29630 [Geomonas sp. Red276]
MKTFWPKLKAWSEPFFKLATFYIDKAYIYLLVLQSSNYYKYQTHRRLDIKVYPKMKVVLYNNTILPPIIQNGSLLENGYIRHVIFPEDRYYILVKLSKYDIKLNLARIPLKPFNHLIVIAAVLVFFVALCAIYKLAKCFV